MPCWRPPGDHLAICPAAESHVPMPHTWLPKLLLTVRHGRLGTTAMSQTLIHPEAYPLSCDAHTPDTADIDLMNAAAPVHGGSANSCMHHAATTTLDSTPQPQPCSLACMQLHTHECMAPCSSSSAWS